jgi:hypothetical protein
VRNNSLPNDIVSRQRAHATSSGRKTKSLQNEVLTNVGTRKPKHNLTAYNGCSDISIGLFFTRSQIGSDQKIGLKKGLRKKLTKKMLRRSEFGTEKAPFLDARYRKPFHLLLLTIKSG